MSRPSRTPWWQPSWLLAVVLAVGVVLVILDIWAHVWLGRAGTVLGLVAVVGARESVRRQSREDLARRRPRS